MNPMNFSKKEKVDAPSLQVGSGAGAKVQRAIAGNASEDIWAGVNIELPD
jgi:hypothetical protein